MYNSIHYIAIAIFLTIFTGCATTSTEPQLTPLEIQSLQTRNFETSKVVAFASTLSVFQDLGYIVASADTATGFITADSPTDSKENWFTGDATSANTRATAFIEEIQANNTTVRLNFVYSQHKSTAYGRDRKKDTPILDATIYQNAFERIENAIFVRSSTNSNN